MNDKQEPPSLSSKFRLLENLEVKKPLALNVLGVNPQKQQVAVTFNDDESDDYHEQNLSLGNNLDDSIEMAMMMLTIDPAQRAIFEKERNITQYLKNNGVKLKTDPRSKQDDYFLQDSKKSQNGLPPLKFSSQESPSVSSIKFLTPILTSQSSYMNLQNNSIMQRRTPTGSPMHRHSSIEKPIEDQSKQDQGKKSRFFQYQKE